MSEEKNYVYILMCADGTLYTGWTNNLEKRLRAHNAGTAAKYTRSRLPVRLAHVESFPTRSEALRRERAIQKLSRAAKLRLLQPCPAPPEPATPTMP
jgi:putative endonuclease